jgi:arylsulfatase
MAYEQNAHVPFIVVHPDFLPGTSDAVTSHLDLLPTLIGMSGAPEPERRKAAAGLPGHDASVALQPKMRKNVHAVRPGVLYNYVGPSTVDVGFFIGTSKSGIGAGGPVDVATLKPHLGKRGFLSFTFDGRYKFARFYAPNDFNAPKTLDELFAHNDVQLFDLGNDPEEMNNLAIDRVKNAATLERMNALLNDLMAKEVGVNDGSFLPEVIRPAGVAALKRR